MFRNMLETNPALFDRGEIFNESMPDSYFHFLQRRQTEDATALFPGKSVENFVAYVRWCRTRSLEKQPQSRHVVLDVKYDQAHLLTVPWWESLFCRGFSFLLMREAQLACDRHSPPGSSRHAHLERSRNRNEDISQHRPCGGTDRAGEGADRPRCPGASRQGDLPGL